MTDVPILLVYRLGGRETWTLPEPAPRWRGWADETGQRFANRCLPLLMANQAGWVIRTPMTVKVIWRGGAGLDQLEVMGPDNRPRDLPAQSHFGYGILTWSIPFLFRTPTGYHLLARGPANAPKDAISPLEGLVETDWAVSPFTMNWKVTRPHTLVCFEQGEAICMVVPQRRGELEAFVPEVADIETQVHVREDYLEWSESRRVFNESLQEGVVDELWQKHYFRGLSPSGRKADEHQTVLRLREFETTFVSEDADGPATEADDERAHGLTRDPDA